MAITSHIRINNEDILVKTDTRLKRTFKDNVYYKEPENNFSPKMVYFPDPTVHKRINIGFSLQGYTFTILRYKI